jgi:potassium efflux system protein
MLGQLYRFMLLCLLFCTGTAVYGQIAKNTQTDTLKKTENFVTRMQQFARTADSTSIEDLKADKAEQIQEATFVEMKKNLQKAKLYLRTGLDTTLAKAELALIANHALLVGKDIFSHQDHIRSYRDLVATEKILKVLLNRSLLQKNSLDKHKKVLSGYKYGMDSLANIGALFAFPKDSVKLTKYLQALLVTAKEAAPVDSLIDQSILQTQTLQNTANLQLYSLESSLEEIALAQKRMSDQLFKREFPLLWNASSSTTSFSDTISYSLQKGKLNLFFYGSSNLGTLIICVLLLGICYIFIQSLKNSYAKKDEEELKDEQLILQYPLASAIFIIANLSQFLFNSPPFAFSLFFWLVAAASLTFLMRGYISKFWMFAWASMLCLFILSSFDNLILLPTITERWGMLILALLGVVLGIVIFKNGKRVELREKLIVYAIGFMMLLAFLSLIFNILGSYNLAKAFLVSGYVNVIIAIMFLWTVRLINQGLQLAFNLYAKDDVSLFFMNFDRVGQKAPALLYVLLVIGWLILFGRNFPAYAFVVEPVRDFFFDQRAIGSYIFSISSLILFFFVVSMAVIISKIVSFFALDKRTFSKQQGTKRGIGSWILLIRITIILLGLFLAFAAVGIPIDKIAIVLGALGVGIGFGLQSLVNNLVSGLVIAFEKPLNLDDEVEIAGKTGTVKSIGFRSSVLSTFDGAEVVLPNGDLLNSHLVNWSSGAHRRRSSILIKIGHGADLQFIKTNVLEILLADERIMKHPEPTILFDSINAEALELNVSYWTKQAKPMLEIKSDTILAINQLFIQHKVKLPYPKQEVFIHQDIKEKK